MKKGQISLMWLLLGTVAILLLPNLLTHGLFVDGLYYGTIARNWALMESECLEFGLSETQMRPFYSHLPLAFWLEGGLYNLLGDRFWVDRFYSLLLTVGSAYGGYAIWHLFWPKKGFWLPFLFWMATPLVFWGSLQNVLELSVQFFAIWAFYFLCFSWERKQPWAAIIAGVLTVGAFLAKGPQGLFLLATPVFYFFFISKQSYRSSLLYYSSVGILIGGLWSWEDWRFYFEQYLEIQLIGSLNQEVKGLGRWSLPKHLIGELFPLILIQIGLYFSNHFSSLKLWSQFDQRSFLFLSIALSASLPLMISNKQMSFYLLPSFSFFAIFFASNLELGKLESWIAKWVFVKYVGIGLMLLAFILMFWRYGEFSRDEEMLQDIFVLDTYLEDGVKVDVADDLSTNWQLLGYASKYAYINFKFNDKRMETDFYLQKKGAKLRKNYKKIPLELKLYQLSTKQNIKLE